jgi:diadenosine tetraphosphatase ApaH/serine/threonine PP2A family protein phosphatase
VVVRADEITIADLQAPTLLRNRDPLDPPPAGSGGGGGGAPSPAAQGPPREPPPVACPDSDADLAESDGSESDSAGDDGGGGHDGGIDPTRDCSEWLSDLLWSDPQLQLGHAFNYRRGVGCLFGPDVTAAFLRRNGLRLLVRSHELKMGGFEIEHHSSTCGDAAGGGGSDCGGDVLDGGGVGPSPADTAGAPTPAAPTGLASRGSVYTGAIVAGDPRALCVTVFSAPDYCGVHGNLGAVLVFAHADLRRFHFVTFEAAPRPAAVRGGAEGGGGGAVAVDTGDEEFADGRAAVARERARREAEPEEELLGAASGVAGGAAELDFGMDAFSGSGGDY